MLSSKQLQLLQRYPLLLQVLCISSCTLELCTHLLDPVAAGQHQGGQGRGSQGRGDGVALLVQVDLAVPLAPHLGGGKHATTAALVAEGTLTGAVGT